jgi:hypothetical protein
MKRAVRKLIKERQKHSKHIVEQVDVEFVGGSKRNSCFINCAEFVEQHKETRRYKVVSGWIVGEYVSEDDSTAITQHYWLYDTKYQKHIDITDTAVELENVTYVIDVDFMLYSQTKFDCIDNCVGHSLWYRKNDWYLICGNLTKGVRISQQAYESLPTPIFYAEVA